MIVGFMPNLGITEFIVLGGLFLSAFTFAIVLWGVIDAAQRPDSAWAAIETSRTLWIGLMAGGLILCFPAGLVLTVYYLVSIRPRLDSVQKPRNW